MLEDLVFSIGCYLVMEKLVYYCILIKCKIMNCFYIVVFWYCKWY